MEQLPRNNSNQTRLGLFGLLVIAGLSLSLAVLAPTAAVFADGNGDGGENAGSETEPNPGETDPDNPDNPDNPDDPDDPDNPDNPDTPDQPDNPNPPSTPITRPTTNPDRPTNSIGGGANRPNPADQPSQNNQVAATTKPVTRPNTNSTSTPAANNVDGNSATSADDTNQQSEATGSDDNQIAALDPEVLPNHEEETSEIVTLDDGTMIAVLALGASLAIALPVAVVVGHKLLHLK